MSLQEKDSQFVWHPFTQQLHAKENIRITKGEGLYLIAEDGTRYMDLISSWWVNLHGHCHPYISQKISEQLFQLEHVLFSGFTHAPAVELARRLLEILPGDQRKIFYSDNGSTAVEVALKMALQYWRNKGDNRYVFFAFEDAYHGDTFGSMSVGARNVFSKAFDKLLFDVKHLPIPNEDNIEETVRTIELIARSGKVAGFIFEPLVQGAAGMKMYGAEYLDRLIAVCKRNNIITIADEVMTGFGRTGKLFAADHLMNSPDIICLSKGLTGGYLPLGVTSCKEFVHEAFLTEDRTKTFFHGHSYTANPLSCAAGLASLDLLQKRETLEALERISASHQKFSERIKGNERLSAVRTCGTILAFEMKTEDSSGYLNPIAEAISDHFLKEGMIIRPLGNVFYIIPPYCITDEELQTVYTSVVAFLNKV